MKVVLINGSSREKGNTAILLNYVRKELEKQGIDTELAQIGGKEIHGCAGCRKCTLNKDRRCSNTDDVANDFIALMDEADGIILGAPTYFTDVPAEMKALIDRSGFVARANNMMFRRKVGAAVVVMRRAGAIHAFDTLNHFFLINEMIVPASSYWNIGIGLHEGDVKEDAEGIKTVQVLGRNMAWLMQQLDGAEGGPEKQVCLSRRNGRKRLARRR
jgi:multimeric flavodoxin WrbA